MYDGHNYLGFEDNPKDETQPIETVEWNMAEFLPKKIGSLFSLIIVGYAHYVYKKKRELLNIAIDESWE